MSKATFKLINKFKDIEKQHSLLIDDKIYHQYILYNYINDEDESIISDLISCLEKIPNKYKIIDDLIYCEKCYVIELNSYTVNKDKANIIAKFKIKFGKQ